jgi:hypothetical protein
LVLGQREVEQRLVVQRTRYAFGGDETEYKRADQQQGLSSLQDTRLREAAFASSLFRCCRRSDTTETPPTRS